jgi:hypothetical protein
MSNSITLSEIERDPRRLPKQRDDRGAHIEQSGAMESYLSKTYSLHRQTKERNCINTIR